MPTSSRRRLAPPPIVAARPIELRVLGDFVEWLAASGGTLAVTTYNSGKLALFSAPDGTLTASYCSLPRPMGLAVSGNQLAVATRDHLWQLEIGSDSLEHAVDRAEVQTITPRQVNATGRLDAHDLAFDRRGLLFANTRFNCVARPSEHANFKRTWQPPFMAHASTAASTDCCHLNGIGVRDGRLAMATAFCERAEPAAWRAGDRFASGVLLDVRQNRVAVRGLSMPHSPRWHDGRWWLCDSGRGALATVHLKRETCEPVIELPGMTRGLTFVGDRAIVGLSRIRKRHILDAPPVRERWPRLRSGIAVVDYARGVETGSLEFVRGGREVYDAAFLPGVTAATFSTEAVGA
ncbi:TIGR03032 family protein [Lacipirellula sp.]|uniref:TIGR03032 family protein n=1 Tax=Lacipirellula sp. TaxID=2691419 RepID=UPI003D0AFD60